MRFLNLTPPQPLGRAVMCPLWLAGIHSPSCQSIAYVHSQSKIKTKTNTLPMLASFCERCGIFPHGERLPERWEPQRDPVHRLGGRNPSVLVSWGALATLPCVTQAGRWDFGECRLCCPSREGSVPCSLLQDCFSILYVLLNWRKNLQF